MGDMCFHAHRLGYYSSIGLTNTHFQFSFKDTEIIITNLLYEFIIIINERLPIVFRGAKVLL